MKTLKAKCVECGKEIFSLYKKQLDYNYKLHLDSCSKKPKGELGKSGREDDAKPNSNGGEESKLNMAVKSVRRGERIVRMRARIVRRRVRITQRNAGVKNEGR